MKAKNVTQDEMYQALKEVNKKYDKNVIFNRFEPVGRQFNFTLRVKDSSKKGARLGFCRNKNGKRRKLIAACWHVHGDFFDALLAINGNAVIKSSVSTIDKNGGNWQDKQVGSMFDIVYFSQLCECD